MPAEMLRESDSEIVIQITIPKSNNFYECEENIRRGLNEGGTLATSKCLEEFDTDGSPILVGNQKLTAKRTKIPKKYETPYGISEVERYARRIDAVVGKERQLPLCKQQRRRDEIKFETHDRQDRIKVLCPGHFSNRIRTGRS